MNRNSLEADRFLDPQGSLTDSLIVHQDTKLNAKSTINATKRSEKDMDCHETYQDQQTSISKKRQKVQSILNPANIQKVKKVIMVSRNQHKLYKTLEQDDRNIRESYRKTLFTKMTTINFNLRKNRKQHNNRFQKAGDRYSHVRRNFNQEQQKIRGKQKEEESRLRRFQQEFFKSQKVQKKRSFERQTNAKVSYQNALQRIEQINRKNLQYAKKSEVELNTNLSRNNKRPEIIRKKSQKSFQSNQKKLKKLGKEKEIRKSKEKGFISTYYRNMSASQKAIKHQQQIKSETDKKIQQFLQFRRSSWKERKQQVEESQKKISPKCQNILYRSTIGNSSSKSFSSSSSSKFHDSNRLWQTRMHRYKEKRDITMKEKEQKMDRHMLHHLDIKIKTKAILKMDQQTNSMASRARNVSALS